MKEFKGSNNTIILNRQIAKQMNLKLYDELGVIFDSASRKLRIIGLFGPETSDNGPILYGVDSRFASSIAFNDYGSDYNSPYDSYVPRDLFNISYPSSNTFQLENFDTNILIKLSPGVNGTEVANQIRSLNITDIRSVDSFDEEWRLSTEMNNVATYGNMQTLDIQSLGLVFAVLSASVGTALIAVVSLRERNREATLMSVRGLSYRQLVWMFLTESMAIITFAVVLGVIVGIIIVYGSVTSANSYSYMSLVSQRLIYPADALATIGTYVALIYAATIGAILVMTSQYVTKLEKMVRSR
jgi:ABC-type antimicrobial peptide transport system permease subunit